MASQSNEIIRIQLVKSVMVHDTADSAPSSSSTTTRQSSSASTASPMTYVQCVQTPIMTVNVSLTETSICEKFLIHSALLAHFSIYFCKILNGNFFETDTNSVLLNADPDLFRHFVEFVYRGGWLLSHSTRKLPQLAFPFLARLYALGERLQATDFQAAIARKFTAHFKGEAGETILCLVLQTLCKELPSRSPEVGLRRFMFAYVADNLGSIRKWKGYQQLLEEYAGLAQAVCTSVDEVVDVRKEFAVEVKGLEEEKPC